MQQKKDEFHQKYNYREFSFAGSYELNKKQLVNIEEPIAEKSI